MAAVEELAAKKKAMEDAAAAYLGYENANTGAATANIHKITSVGLRKSF